MHGFKFCEFHAMRAYQLVDHLPKPTPLPKPKPRKTKKVKPT